MHEDDLIDAGVPIACVDSAVACNLRQIGYTTMYARTFKFTSSTRDSAQKPAVYFIHLEDQLQRLDKFPSAYIGPQYLRHETSHNPLQETLLCVLEVA